MSTLVDQKTIINRINTLCEEIHLTKVCARWLCACGENSLDNLVDTVKHELWTVWDDDFTFCDCPDADHPSRTAQAWVYTTVNNLLCNIARQNRSIGIVNFSKNTTLVQLDEIILDTLEQRTFNNQSHSHAFADCLTASLGLFGLDEFSVIKRAVEAVLNLKKDFSKQYSYSEWRHICSLVYLYRSKRLNDCVADCIASYCKGVKPELSCLHVLYTSKNSRLCR